jgi:hypothetical protein
LEESFRSSATLERSFRFSGTLQKTPCADGDRVFFRELI